ncbi:MAG: c-type cytochrome [Acidiferrobacterales bacterium]
MTAVMPHIRNTEMTGKIVLFLLGVALLAGMPASSRAAGPEPALTARLQAIENNPAALKSLIQDGKDQTDTFCVYCHGNGGNSTNPDIPNLAEQNPAYLLAQLRQFAHGQREDEYVSVMQKLAKTFTPAQEVTIAAYFAALPLTAAPAANADLAIQGKLIYAQRCVACHGRDGLGNGEYPRLASQEPGYVIRTLTNFRDHADSRPSKVMSNATMGLKDADIQGLAAYVARMPVKSGSYLGLYPTPGFPGDN